MPVDWSHVLIVVTGIVVMLAISIGISIAIVTVIKDLFWR